MRLGSASIGWFDVAQKADSVKAWSDEDRSGVRRPLLVPPRSLVNVVPQIRRWCRVVAKPPTDLHQTKP